MQRRRREAAAFEDARAAPVLSGRRPATTSYHCATVARSGRWSSGKLVLAASKRASACELGSPSSGTGPSDAPEPRKGMTRPPRRLSLISGAGRLRSGMASWPVDATGSAARLRARTQSRGRHRPRDRPPRRWRDRAVDRHRHRALPPQRVRPQVSATTRCAPAALRALAHALSVAPVVCTSSTRIALRGAGPRAWKASRPVARRSSREAPS